MIGPRNLLLLVALLAVPALEATAGEPVAACISDAGCDWELGGDPLACGECCSCGRYGYISGIVGVSLLRGDSGGFNTAGAFDNTNDASDEVFTAGGAIGLAIPQLGHAPRRGGRPRPRRVPRRDRQLRASHAHVLL